MSFIDKLILLHSDYLLMGVLGLAYIALKILTTKFDFPSIKAFNRVAIPSLLIIFSNLIIIVNYHSAIAQDIVSNYPCSVYEKSYNYIHHQCDLNDGKYLIHEHKETYKLFKRLEKGN